MNHHYDVTVSGIGGCDNAPARATFDVSKDQAIEILRLCAIARALDAYRIEKFDFSCTYLRYATKDFEEMLAAGDLDDEESNNEISSDCHMLSVGTDEFWFNANFKNDDDEFETMHMSIQELAEVFDLPFPPAPASIGA